MPPKGKNARKRKADAEEDVSKSTDGVGAAEGALAEMKASTAGDGSPLKKKANRGRGRKKLTQRAEDDSEVKEKEAKNEKEVKNEEHDGESSNKKQKKPKKVKPIFTDRTKLERRLVPVGTQVLKICTWNVNGLAALHKKSLQTLHSLVEGEQPDVLCLQETKIQEGHVTKYTGLLKSYGYSDYWSCSQVKKGYAGTCCFVKEGDGRPQVRDVTYGIGKADGGHCDAEGRVVTVEYDELYVVNVYVPNSGMKLERLDYRLNKWNPCFAAYLEDLRKQKPTIVTGDLNVAHLDDDIYNLGHPHVKKVPGCTPEERQAQTEFLESGWVDLFRQCHPEVNEGYYHTASHEDRVKELSMAHSVSQAKGAYTYWSLRCAARPGNRGLRLDYFIAPEEDAKGERGVKPLDCYILHEETLGVSDHCPVGCTVALKTA